MSAIGPVRHKTIFVGDFFVFNLKPYTQTHTQTDTFHIVNFPEGCWCTVYVYANKIEKEEVLKITDKQKQSTGI